MTDMDDEAMKAMADRIADAAVENHAAAKGTHTWEIAREAALAAIIETQERCAALAERLFDKSGCHAMYKNAGHQAAAAIRSGQQFRKDERHD